MRFDNNLHVAIDDIVNNLEIAKMLGVTPAAISNWKVRYHDSFPAPFKTFGNKEKLALYRRSDILHWYAEHFPERVAAARELATILNK